MIIALKYFFEKKGLHLAVPFLSHIVQKVNAIVTNVVEEIMKCLYKAAWQ